MSSVSSSGQAEVTTGSGEQTTLSGSASGTSGPSSTSTTTGDESTGSLNPETVCRTWPDPEMCPYGGSIGLPEPQDCKSVGVYFYDSGDVCDVEFETRCEVLARSITGGPTACSVQGYSEGWFRELKDGRVEFWGVQASGDNPPVEL